MNYFTSRSPFQPYFSMTVWLIWAKSKRNSVLFTKSSFFCKVDETLELEGLPKINGLKIIFVSEISEGKLYASKIWGVYPV